LKDIVSAIVCARSVCFGPLWQQSDACRHVQPSGLSSNCDGQCQAGCCTLGYSEAKEVCNTCKFSL